MLTHQAVRAVTLVETQVAGGVQQHQPVAQQPGLVEDLLAEQAAQQTRAQVGQRLAADLAQELPSGGPPGSC